jgi:hypothetical protein
MISEVPYRSLTEHRGTYSSLTEHRGILQEPQGTQGYLMAASQNTGVPYSSLTEHRGTASAAVHNASDSERHRVHLGLAC